MGRCSLLYSVRSDLPGYEEMYIFAYLPTCLLESDGAVRWNKSTDLPFIVCLPSDLIPSIISLRLVAT